MLSFYSLITMFAIARSIGVVVSGTTDAKLVHIICTPEEGRVLREWILNSLDRTATRSPSYGLYSEQEKEILLLVVRQKELPAITAGCEGTGARLLCGRDRRLRCLRLSLESASRCGCTADSLSDECDIFPCFDALFIDFPARPFAVGRSGRLAFGTLVRGRTALS